MVSNVPLAISTYKCINFIFQVCEGCCFSISIISIPCSRQLALAWYLHNSWNRRQTNKECTTTTYYVQIILSLWQYQVNFNRGCLKKKCAKKNMPSFDVNKSNCNMKHFRWCCSFWMLFISANLDVAITFYSLQVNALCPWAIFSQTPRIPPTTKHAQISRTHGKAHFKSTSVLFWN